MATINVSIINRDDIDLNYDFDALTFNALTVHSLKSIVIIHLYNVYYCYLKAEDVVVIHHGSQLTDSNSLLSSLVDHEESSTSNITQQQLHLYVFLVDSTVASVFQTVNLSFDDLSISAAQQYLDQKNVKAVASDGKVITEEDLDAIQLRRFASAMCKTNNAHTVEELNQPAGQPAPQQLPAGNPPGAAGIVWFQWGLLLKLIVTCLLFTYNHRRPMDYYRQANIICVAFLCYLIQIGAIYYWFKMICDILLGHNWNIFAPGPQLDRRLDEHNPQQPIHDGAAAPPVACLWQQLVDITQSGFKVPTAPGIFFDLISFAMGIVCSIVPQWTHINL